MSLEIPFGHLSAAGALGMARLLRPIIERAASARSS